MLFSIQLIRNDTTIKIDYIDAKIQYKKNQADILTFDIIENSDYFNKLNKITDYIKVIDNRNNKKIFDGRIISTPRSMDNGGIYKNTITCESVLNYLNDTYSQKWAFYPLDVPPKSEPYALGNYTTKMFLSKVLDNHNNQVDDSKKIYLGNVIDEAFSGKVDFQTSLDCTISQIVNTYDGYLIIRNENGCNYLDFLTNLATVNTVNVDMGVNMQSIEIDDTSSNIFSRLIPFGKNSIDITSVNKGIYYIDNNDLINKYGVIEKIIKFDDITIASELLEKAKLEFNKAGAANTISLTALDLSYINNDFSKLQLFTLVNLNNKILNYNETHEIVSIDLDLINPWESTFDLNQCSQTLTDTVSSINEQVNQSIVEIVKLGDSIIQKVSNDEFESYKLQTASEIENKVSEGDLKTDVIQNADSWGLSINGNLTSKNYKFDQDGFWISGKSGNCELTDTQATWKDNKGDSFTVGATGFTINSQGVSGKIKYCNFIIKRANIKNGSIEDFQLPNNFIGKSIDSDFSITTLWDGIDSNTDAVFKKDALRNIFIRITNWNSSTAVLSVQPCIQKIGLDTNTYFGYDSASTTAGNPVGEGSMDIIIIVSM